MGQFSENAHWRDTAREAKFFMIDWTAALPIMLWLVHISMTTFLIALMATVFLAALNYKKYTIMVFFRIVRSLFSGKRKLASPWWI